MKINIVGDKKIPRTLKAVIALKVDVIKKHFQISDKHIRIDTSGYMDEFELEFTTGVWMPIEMLHLLEITDLDTLPDYSCMGDQYLWRWL